MKRIFTIIGIALLLVACDKPETIIIDGEEYMSASACAERLSNGKVVECEPTQESEDRLLLMLKQSRIIDAENPGPDGPNLLDIEQTEWHKISVVDSQGTVVLENGVELMPAGLECNPSKSVDYLKATFVRDSSAKLAYLPTGLKNKAVEYAYIWALGATDDPDFGPSLSSVNENLIISESCRPIAQEGHTFHRRYERLAGLR